MTSDHLPKQVLQNSNAVDGSAVSWSLVDLLAQWVEVSVEDDRVLSGVQLDSRLLAEGNLFIALNGLTVNALDYLDDVIAIGAAAVVCDSNGIEPTAEQPFADQLLVDRRIKMAAASIPLIEIDNLSIAAGEIVSRYYSDPSRMLKVVGVTGTDGKTSVCHMVGQALNEHRNNCGIIGTLGWGFSGNLREAGLTTPDSLKLQKTLTAFQQAGAAYAAMEVSSHALSQGRTSGVVFDVAVLTNLGRDHLDYHGDMKSYRAAKEMLFFQPELRAAVINSDDEAGLSLIGRLTDLELTTFGGEAREGSHVRYVDVTQTSTGLSFSLEFDRQRFPVQSVLLGKFNIQNLAATFAVLVALGLSPELAAQSLSSLSSVPGRMEATRLSNGAMAIVDYAHNPHALESVLRSVSEHVEGRVLLVFGCGGDRDQGKRALMAGVAERYADVCIVTDDNPRTENGDEIIRHILLGFSDASPVIVERDRKAAIGVAINKATAGDLVVIAGKGHEDYQIIGDQRLAFSDSKVVAIYAQAQAS